MVPVSCRFSCCRWSNRFTRWRYSFAVPIIILVVNSWRKCLHHIVGEEQKVVPDITGKAKWFSLSVAPLLRRASLTFIAHWQYIFCSLYLFLVRCDLLHLVVGPWKCHPTDLKRPRIRIFGMITGFCLVYFFCISCLTCGLLIQ